MSAEEAVISRFKAARATAAEPPSGMDQASVIAGAAMFVVVAISGVVILLTCVLSSPI